MAEMTPADKAKAQMRSMGLSAPYIGSKETRTEEEIKQDQKTLAENVPILGEAMLAKEIGEDIKDKNYLSAGLNTLALGVGVVPGVGKVASKPIRSAARAVRKGYNPKDPASRVFHLTKKDFDAADVVGKGTSDIGFHVGTAAQASGRGSTGLGYDRELMEKMVEGERILPLVLKYNLKPARIPDMSSFKSPQNWIGNLSVAKSDRSRIEFLLGEQADADLLAKAPRVKVGGDTYYMLPDVMREGMDPELWKDLILEASRAKRIGLDTVSKQEDRITWFSTLKHTANKHGYDSFVYKNEYEGNKYSTGPQDSYMLLEADQAKGLFGEMTEGSPEFMKNKGGLMLQKGGAIPMNNMAQQMELFEPVKTGFNSGGLTKSTSSDQLLIDFNAIAEDYNESRNISGSQRAITGQEMMYIFDALTGNKIKLTPVNMQEGGLLDEGGTKDPVSGNDVPSGSMQEEVRDDIPAQLSEGEFVFPADVVRFIGLEKLMKIRQRAKAGLKMMEEMGQMGNSEEAIIPDDLPFSIDDLDMEDDGLEMAQGGVVSMANGGSVGSLVKALPGPNLNLPSQTGLGSQIGQIGTFNPRIPGTAGMNPLGTAAAPMQAASSGGVDPNLGGTKFTGTAIQPITMPFQEAKGPGVINVEEKNVVYVNEAGQERTFIVRADGTVIDPATGQEVNPETLGFKVKTDEPKTQTTTGTGVKTAQVSEGQDDNQQDDGTGGGAKVAWGGEKDMSKRGGPFGGLKKDFTMVGISYDKIDPTTGKPQTGIKGIPNPYDMASVVGNVAIGGKLPDGYGANMIIDNVKTPITNTAFNQAKAAGYMGKTSKGMLDRAKANVAVVTSLGRNYNISKPDRPTTVDDLVEIASKTDIAVEKLANKYGIDLDTVKETGIFQRSKYDNLIKAIAAKNGITEEEAAEKHEATVYGGAVADSIKQGLIDQGQAESAIGYVGGGYEDESRMSDARDAMNDALGRDEPSFAMDERDTAFEDAFSAFAGSDEDE